LFSHADQQRLTFASIVLENCSCLDHVMSRDLSITDARPNNENHSNSRYFIFGSGITQVKNQAFIRDQSALVKFQFPAKCLLSRPLIEPLILYRVHVKDIIKIKWDFLSNGSDRDEKKRGEISRTASTLD
jgi:hypothetical protein